MERPISGLPFLGDTPPFIYEPVIEQVPRVTAVNPNSGRTVGGTSVTIRGFNFRYLSDGLAPSVLFDGVAATSVVVVDARMITCVTPEHPEPGVVNVAVTINGQTGTAYGVFTYFESTITRITPNHGPISGGTEVLIEGYNFLDGSIILFDETQASSIIFIDSQHFSCITPNHSVGFVDVQIIEPLL